MYKSSEKSRRISENKREKCNIIKKIYNSNIFFEKCAQESPRKNVFLLAIFEYEKKLRTEKKQKTILMVERFFERERGKNKKTKKQFL